MQLKIFVIFALVCANFGSFGSVIDNEVNDEDIFFSKDRRTSRILLEPGIKEGQDILAQFVEVLADNNFVAKEKSRQGRDK